MPSAASAAADTGIAMQMKTSTPQMRARLSREKSFPPASSASPSPPDDMMMRSTSLRRMVARNNPMAAISTAAKMRGRYRSTSAVIASNGRARPVIRSAPRIAGMNARMISQKSVVAIVKLRLHSRPPVSTAPSIFSSRRSACIRSCEAYRTAAATPQAIRPRIAAAKMFGRNPMMSERTSRSGEAASCRLRRFSDCTTASRKTIQKTICPAIFSARTTGAAASSETHAERRSPMRHRFMHLTVSF